MAGEFGHQDASLTGEQIEYGAASFFVEHVSGLLLAEFFARCGGRDPLFVSNFFLYRLVSFVHLQKRAAPSGSQIYEYSRMGDTTRVIAPVGLGWSGLSPQAAEANSPSNWPNMTSNAG